MPVTILMPVLNGADFLQEQLESLARQTLLPRRVLAFDDGSQDGSRRILDQFARMAPFEMRTGPGPGRGHARNVAALLRAAGPGSVAFCDQDDVWLPDRLMRADRALRCISRPALVVSARLVTGPRLQAARPAPVPRATNFRCALLRNPAPANATVLNASAAQLARQFLPEPGALPPFPDWWVHALVLGAGGTVIFDAAPGLLYRQHRGNMLGGRHGRHRLRRMLLLADGTYDRWLRDQTRALQLASAALTPGHRAELAVFAARLGAARSPPFMSRGTISRIALGLSRI
ncbi:putative glycosyltransferase [Pseudooceanicola batsensis HTCC2597]|uniref:Putative glycosyltransferase n=1 Tax=Pseudooceanicola batsensis (strain ATCC BAA-863 / DSM 15984 / KCTC 12145 / HTCC2597) TaxID=252305 RepID=A3TY53_PSEBH|nr:glycosyltransferase [Pseudooceanicola batsensis]EAQ03087.1 putative glycosyltransferase [Pseudooceanicola batsensis HTCC2597]